MNGEVTKDRWDNAQYHELLTWSKVSRDGDDWNKWWAEKFGNYSFLNNHDINTIMEVGCGPFAKNMEFVLKALRKQPSKIILEDPLINEYIKLSKSIIRFQDRAIFKSEPIEDLSMNGICDLVICINVFDHVRSVSKCFSEIYNSLSPNGLFIFGQEVTHPEDVKIMENDIKRKIIPPDYCHPIYIDESVMQPHIDQYRVIKKDILPRAEGRNPKLHYGTLIFIGEK